MCSRASQKGQKSSSGLLLRMFNLGVGGSFLWWVQGRGNGLEDKINIPFVLLATPAVRKIMLDFFF